MAMLRLLILLKPEQSLRSMGRSRILLLTPTMARVMALVRGRFIRTALPRHCKLLLLMGRKPEGILRMEFVLWRAMDYRCFAVALVRSALGCLALKSML